MERLDGVKDASVDFASKTASIWMEDGKKLDGDTVKKALEDAGYGMDSMKSATSDKAEPKDAEKKDDKES